MTLKIGLQNQILTIVNTTYPKYPTHRKVIQESVILIFWAKFYIWLLLQPSAPKVESYYSTINTSHADCLVVFVLRKEGRNFIMMQDKKPCANYAQRAKQMQYWHTSKIHIFWEGFKILQNLHQLFVLFTASQIIGGNFAKFCDLLRIYEL